MELLDPFDIAFWARLAAAVLCGGLVGLERQLRGKPAGMRTSSLICVGTFYFVALGASIVGESADPTRVLGQVVTGIGFLGAGVILAREGIVIGVTSAAVIWVLAAIGAGIALGFVIPSIVVTLVTVGILLGVERMESSYERLRRGVHAWRPFRRDLSGRVIAGREVGGRGMGDRDMGGSADQ